MMSAMDMSGELKEEAKISQLKKLIGEMSNLMISMDDDQKSEMGHADGMMSDAMKESEDSIDPTKEVSHDEVPGGEPSDDEDNEFNDYKRGFMKKGSSMPIPKGSALMMKVAVAKGKPGKR